MFRQFLSFRWAVIPLAFVAVCSLPPRSEAQSTSAIIAALEQPIETKEFSQAPVSLKNVLTSLVAQLKVNGKQVAILVDVEGFKAENPDMPDIYETTVDFPPFPEKLKASAVLRWSIDKIATRNATYVVMPDRILVTTEARVGPEWKLKQYVRGVYKGRLAEVLQELSDDIGITIVLDTRVGDKAKTEVLGRFLTDTPLAGVIRVFTEMADLKVLVLDGVILVTTPVHAETLRKEHQIKAEQLEKRKADVTKTRPGLPGFPPHSLNDLGQWLDPLWPYDPSRGPGLMGPAK